MPFCRNNAIFSKEAKVRKALPKVSPRPEGADCGRKKNQSPLFVKKENMGTCRMGKGVQSLLNRDDGGEKRPGKGAREKDHTEAFYDKKRHRKDLSEACRRRNGTGAEATAGLPGQSKTCGDLPPDNIILSSSARASHFSCPTGTSDSRSAPKNARPAPPMPPKPARPSSGRSTATCAQRQDGPQARRGPH